jgi:hypothetical protein
VRAILGAFASSRAQERFGADIATGLEAAVRHYERCLRSNSALVALPPRAFAAEPDLPVIETDFELSPVSTTLLEAESSRLGVDPQLLLNHAVLVYLAHLDRRARRRESGGRMRGRPPLGR